MGQYRSSVGGFVRGPLLDTTATSDVSASLSNTASSDSTSASYVSRLVGSGGSNVAGGGVSRIAG